MRRYLEMLERERRRNHIVMQESKIGTADENDLKIAMENFLEKELEVKPKVRNARKIDQKICVVELENMTKK